jgi:uncharacterized integral membrane protein
VVAEEGMTNQEGPASQGDRSRRQLGAGAIASLTGVGVLLVFIIQNTDDVRFDFLFFHFTWPLWLYTIVTAVFGAVVWIGLGVMRRHRRRVARREARRD